MGNVSACVSVIVEVGVCVSMAVVGATVAGRLWEIERARKDNNKKADIGRPRPLSL